MNSSKLYIVPTPIGNLKDITLRAIETLKNSDLILAEDTRTSKKLLKEYGIETQLRSFHQHNEHKVLKNIIDELKSGKQISIISDAGTPGISDPGYLLVRECIVQEIEIETLPGATAFIPALINSGFPNHNFIFEGFLPLKKGRKSKLEELAKESRTFILYESPHRLVKTLNQLNENLGENRKVSVSRELTKIHEETKRGSFQDVISYYTDHPPKGECVIVIENVK